MPVHSASPSYALKVGEFFFGLTIVKTHFRVRVNLYAGSPQTMAKKAAKMRAVKVTRLTLDEILHQIGGPEGLLFAIIMLPKMKKRPRPRPRCTRKK